MRLAFKASPLPLPPSWPCTAPTFNQSPHRVPSCCCLCCTPIWPACPSSCQFPKSGSGPACLSGDVFLSAPRASPGGLLVWEAGHVQGASGGVPRAAQEASGVPAPQGQCPQHSTCPAAFSCCREGHLCPLSTAAAGVGERGGGVKGGPCGAVGRASGAPVPPVGSGLAAGLSS